MFRKLLLFTAFAGAVAVLASTGPDILRYLRMRSM
jgi:hypothetical protein